MGDKRPKRKSAAKAESANKRIAMAATRPLEETDQVTEDDSEDERPAPHRRSSVQSETSSNKVTDRASPTDKPATGMPRSSNVQVVIHQPPSSSRKSTAPSKPTSQSFTPVNSFAPVNDFQRPSSPSHQSANTSRPPQTENAPRARTSLLPVHTQPTPELTMQETRNRWIEGSKQGGMLKSELRRGSAVPDLEPTASTLPEQSNIQQVVGIMNRNSGTHRQPQLQQNSYGSSNSPCLEHTQATNSINVCFDEVGPAHRAATKSTEGTMAPQAPASFATTTQNSGRQAQASPDESIRLLGMASQQPRQGLHAKHSGTAQSLSTQALQYVNTSTLSSTSLSVPRNGYPHTLPPRPSTYSAATTKPADIADTIPLNTPRVNRYFSVTVPLAANYPRQISEVPEGSVSRPNDPRAISANLATAASRLLRLKGAAVQEETASRSSQDELDSEGAPIANSSPSRIDEDHSIAPSPFSHNTHAASVRPRAPVHTHVLNQAQTEASSSNSEPVPVFFDAKPLARPRHLDFNYGKRSDSFSPYNPELARYQQDRDAFYDWEPEVMWNDADEIAPVMNLDHNVPFEFLRQDEEQDEHQLEADQYGEEEDADEQDEEILYEVDPSSDELYEESPSEESPSEESRSSNELDEESQSEEDQDEEDPFGEAQDVQAQDLQSQDVQDQFEEDQSSDELNEDVQDEEGQDEEVQDEEGQDEEGQDEEGQDEEGQDEEGQDEEGQDEEGQDEEDQSSDELDEEEQDEVEENEEEYAEKQHDEWEQYEMEQYQVEENEQDHGKDLFPTDPDISEPQFLMTPESVASLFQDRIAVLSSMEDRSPENDEELRLSTTFAKTLENFEVGRASDRASTPRKDFPAYRPKFVPECLALTQLPAATEVEIRSHSPTFDEFMTEDDDSCVFCNYECSFGIADSRVWLPEEASLGFCGECHDKTREVFRHWEDTYKFPHSATKEKKENFKNWLETSATTPLKELGDILDFKSQVRREMSQSSRVHSIMTASRLHDKDDEKDRREQRKEYNVSSSVRNLARGAKLPTRRATISETASQNNLAAAVETASAERPGMSISIPQVNAGAQARPYDGAITPNSAVFMGILSISAPPGSRMTNLTTPSRSGPSNNRRAAVLPPNLGNVSNAASIDTSSRPPSKSAQPTGPSGVPRYFNDAPSNSFLHRPPPPLTHGPIFCRGCPWRQLDFTKAKICTACRDGKMFICSHTQHTNFRPLVDMPGVFNRTSQIHGLGRIGRDGKFFADGRYANCMVCTGAATHGCFDCPLRLCGECMVKLARLSKGKVSELLNSFNAQREHIRNDAFLLRSDAKGF